MRKGGGVEADDFSSSFFFIISTSESRWKMQIPAKGAELCPLGHSLGEIKKVVVPTPVKQL